MASRARRLLASPYTALLAVLLLAAAVRMVFYVDQVLDEGISIAQQADRFSAFLFSPRRALLEMQATAAAQRLPVAAVAVAYAILGVSTFSTALLPVLAALLTGVVIFSLARLWRPQTAGPLAALLWLALPVGVFLSSNLLPAPFMILLNALTVYFYLQAREREGRRLYLASAVLFLAGIWLQWTYMAASAAFVLADLGSRRLPEAWKKRLPAAIFAAAVVLLLVTQSGPLALEHYYLIRMVEENLIVLPLLALAGVYAASVRQKERPSEILIWLAAKLLFLMAGAKWIAADPQIATIGMGAYWLDLMVPGSLLIAWALDHKLKGGATSSASWVSFGAVFLLLLGVQSEGMLTVSRIAFGLALVLFMLLLAVWNSSLPRFQTVFAGFLAVFLLGSFSLAHNYLLSYRGPSDNAHTLLASLANEREATLYVIDEELLPRLSYMLGFQPSPIQTGQGTLTILAHIRGGEEDPPAGAFVVMSQLYRNFLFGLPPANWVLLEEIGDEGLQQLLLFQVSPER